MRDLPVLLFSALFLAAGSVAAQVHKCTDTAGHVTYTEQACVSTARAEEVKIVLSAAKVTIPNSQYWARQNELFKQRLAAREQQEAAEAEAARPKKTSADSKDSAPPEGSSYHPTCGSTGNCPHFPGSKPK